MYKNTAQIEKIAAIENVADPKITSDGKIMADVKIKADPRIPADEEIPAAREKQADGKILEFPAADFSPVLLMNSRSDPRRCDESCMQSPSEE